MATPWEDPIKKSKQLTVFLGPNTARSSWAAIFTSALSEFNRLSSLYKLGVTMTQTASPPDDNGSGGAHVQFETASSRATFKAFGQTFSQSFDGTGLHGLTQQVKTGTTDVDMRLMKAFIFVPTPQRSIPLGAAKSFVQHFPACHCMMLIGHFSSGFSEVSSVCES